MRYNNLLASIICTLTLLATPSTAQIHGGNGQPGVVQPERPEIQPPVGNPRPPKPPRPPRPEIQPPRPPVYPPRPPIYPPVTSGRLELYPAPAFHGRPHIFKGSASDLKRYGAANSALSLNAIGRWQVCSKKKYKGHCQTVSGRVLNLNRYGLARSISSVRYLGR